MNERNLDKLTLARALGLPTASPSRKVRAQKEDALEDDAPGDDLELNDGPVEQELEPMSDFESAVEPDAVEDAPVTDPKQAALESLHAVLEDIQDEELKERGIAALADLTAALFPDEGEKSDDLAELEGDAAADHDEPDADDMPAFGAAGDDEDVQDEGEKAPFQFESLDPEANGDGADDRLGKL